MKLVIETTNQKYFRICVHIQCFLGWKQPGANYMSTSVKSLLLLCYKSFLKKTKISSITIYSAGIVNSAQCWKYCVYSILYWGLKYKQHRSSWYLCRKQMLRVQKNHRLWTEACIEAIDTIRSGVCLLIIRKNVGLGHSDANSEVSPQFSWVF